MVSEVTRNEIERQFSSLNPCSCGGWSQRHNPAEPEILEKFSLNPCSCGGWSQSVVNWRSGFSQESLNPCSCGGWSQSYYKSWKIVILIVLILVLVEDGLRDNICNKL